MITGLLLSSVVVIPVFGLLFGFAWRYRENNSKAKYSPKLDHSRMAETIWWLVPSVLILIISIMDWHSSYTLDPYRPLVAKAKPLTIQVIALDWKWLFIYPQQNIASVNFVQFPAGTPVNFDITADAPMNKYTPCLACRPSSSCWPARTVPFMVHRPTLAVAVLPV
jgi:cytochrome o ubiquinol oxidase subunit 2